MVATVEAGRVIRLEGDPNHPIGRGTLCARTYRYPERVYAGERILRPARRDGDRFVDATWDEALDAIAEELSNLRACARTHALLHVQSSGSMGVLKNLSARFWNLLGGVTVAEGDFCLGAAKSALVRHLGDYRAHEYDDIQNSRRVVLWGRDPFISGPHRALFLKEARARGAHIVSINPLRITNSNLVDEHIPLRPGGDAFFAAGVLRVLVEEDAIDTTFVEQHTEGFERCRRAAESVSIARLAALAGTSEPAIRDFARGLARDRPTSILLGTGAIRYRHGVAASAWVSALPALLGDYGRRGGGLSYSVRHLRDTPQARWLEPNAHAKRREVSAGRWHYLIDALDPPIEFLWVNGANPAAMLPGATRMTKTLEGIRLKVAVDFHWTDTARNADWVLPHVSFLEEEGLVSSWGHAHLAWQNRAIDPIGEARTDLEIFQALADRLGFGAEMVGSAENWSRRLLGERLGDDDWKILREGAGVVRNAVHEPIPWQGGIFARPGGRYLFPSELPEETCLPEPSAEFPYLLLTPKNREQHLSQRLASTEPDALSGTMGEDVALAIGADGETLCRIRSRYGSIPARLRPDPNLAPGLVVIPTAGSVARGTCVNLLTGPECAEDGVTAAYYDCPVEVRRV